MPGAIVYGNALNQQSPLPRGLVGFWLGLPGLSGGRRIIDLSNPANSGTLNGATWTIGTNGFGALSSTGGATQWAQNSAAVGLPTAALAAWTIAYAHRTRSYVSLSSPFGWGVDPIVERQGALRAVLQYNGNYYAWGAAADWDTGIPYDTDGVPHYIVLAFDGASRFLYRDGVLRASSTAGVSSFVAPVGWSPSTACVWANSRHSAGNCPDADFLGGAVWNRCLTDTDVTVWTDQSRRGFPNLLNRLRPTTYGGFGSTPPTPFCPDLSIQSIPHRTHPKMVAY